MIDALFGSKTRVKLLHLFLNNPGKAFYVREITRLIDEQINSVRRELSNMLNVGIITSDNADNKLYYEVNKQYDYYLAFRAIFADEKVTTSTTIAKSDNWQNEIKSLGGLRVALAAGVLVKGSASSIDLVLIGDLDRKKVTSLISKIEQEESRELNYTVLSYDDFYYRLSMRDKFLTQILNGKHAVLFDADAILKGK